MLLSDIKTEDLKAELKRRGYATHCLWSTADVVDALSDYNLQNETTFEISQKEAMRILEDALAHDDNFETINDNINGELEAFLKVENNEA